MSYISDKDSAPISLFGVNGGNTSNDASLATLVGAKFQTNDSREFVLVQAGATALVAGNVIQSPANLADFVSLATVGNQVVGSTSITVTLGGVAVVANEFQGGYAIVSATSTTGYGQTVKISSHPAQSSTSGSLVLTLEDPLSVALTGGTSTVTMILPAFGSQNGTVASATVSALGVIQAPATTLTGRVLGVATYPIPASTSTVPSYGFIQTRGECGVLSQGGTAIGLDVMSPGSAAGAVATYAVASGTRVGSVNLALTDGAVGSVNLQL